MRDFEVATGQPCDNTTRRRDGAYVCDVNYVTGRGPRKWPIKFGSTDPSGQPVKELVDLLRRQVGVQDPAFRGRELPLTHMIGFSVLRTCVRDVHQYDMPRQNVVDSPRIERVAAFALVRSVDAIVEIKPHPVVEIRRPTDKGVARARRVGFGAESMTDVQLQYLAVTPQERKDHAMLAIQTLSARGRAGDVFVPLHPLTDQDGFVEQIVTLDELQ